jgi:hypothetical protein
MRAPNPEATNESAVLAETVKVLTNMNCDASLAVVERTRCAVREAALLIQEQRIQRRRNFGFALAVMVCLLLLLGPAIWNSVDDLFGGEEDLGGLPSQMAVFLLMLAPAMLAALVAFWKEQRDVYHQRRGL